MRGRDGRFFRLFPKLNDTIHMRKASSQFPNTLGFGSLFYGIGLSTLFHKFSKQITLTCHSERVINNLYTKPDQ